MSRSSLFSSLMIYSFVYPQTAISILSLYSSYVQFPYIYHPISPPQLSSRVSLIFSSLIHSSIVPAIDHYIFLLPMSLEIFITHHHSLSLKFSKSIPLSLAISDCFSLHLFFLSLFLSLPYCFPLSHS